MTPCLIVITLKRIIPSSLVRVCIRDVCIMIRAIAFLPTVGECICASFPLAIVTYDTHITATVCLAWSTHNAALPKVHGTNQHENSAHSCSRPILYATIMASEIKMLIYRQKKTYLKNKDSALPSRPRQGLRIPGSLLRHAIHCSCTRFRARTQTKTESS